MRRAHYEILAEEEGFFGSIPPLPSVWATGTSLEICRADLVSALEDWLLFSFSRQDSLPVLEGIHLGAGDVG